MTVSFKQFATFMQETRGVSSPQQLDELFGKIFGKEEDKEGKREKILSAKEKLAQKKEAENARKKELEAKRNEQWQRAKDQAEGQSRPAVGGKSDRDALHRNMKESLLQVVTEGRTRYSDEGYWKDDAKAAGYKVKKISGNLMDGDQTWGAFNEKDEKMGEFTEKEEGRGGWLIEGGVKERDEGRNKQPGFFTIDDTKKIQKLDLDAAKKYLNDKIEKTEGASSANVHKAKSMVAKATSINKLMIDVSNFVLAHESSKNRVIR